MLALRLQRQHELGVGEEDLQEDACLLGKRGRGGDTNVQAGDEGAVARLQVAHRPERWQRRVALQLPEARVDEATVLMRDRGRTVGLLVRLNSK
mgnify:CR=1 FL=1